MSVNGHSLSQTGFDPNDHQTSYIFTPFSSLEEPPRPKKRRKMSKQRKGDLETSESVPVKFTSLLNGAETSHFVELRQRLFKESWRVVESRVESILEDSNEETLAEVTCFVDKDLGNDHGDQIPTALIVTGPNIASQELLFSQVASRLRSETNNLIIILRSIDASNLKTVLKKLIRDATNQNLDDEDEVRITGNGNGRKLLNYDLELLQNYLVSSSYSKVVVAFQDSEAFDNNLLAELLLLFRSWLDRIPFVLLFGIATSVELFHERLPGAVLRSMYGAQFDVEQTSQTLDRIFQKVVSGFNAPLRFGSTFIASILERQHDHVQSLQNFITALKYAYMCHFYANPLSVLLEYFHDGLTGSTLLQSEHLEAVRMLPSFQYMIEALLDENVDYARELLESDASLFDLIQVTLRNSANVVTRTLRSVQVFATALDIAKGKKVDRMDLYVKAFGGQLGNSDIQDLASSILNLTSHDVVSLVQEVSNLIAFGDSSSDLIPWSEEEVEFTSSLDHILAEITELQRKAETLQTPLRSKYAAQNKTLRTTVVAQKVQLSREISTLSILDLSFNEVVDELSLLIETYLFKQFNVEQANSLFLHEIWLYDLKSPNRETLTPKPRQAVERALCNPHDYLSCTCCRLSEEGLSSSQPATAILYQLYLETSGLINVFDLWSAFYTIIGGEDRDGCDERAVLVLFYKALADLKLLGMIKQSRKKTDHLAKLAWRGL